MDISLISIFTFLMWGIIWFLVSLLIMIFLFGLAGRELLKDNTKILIWFLISLTLPLSLSLVTHKIESITQAKNQPKITLEESVVVDDQTLINLTTNVPAIVYLEILDEKSNLWLPVMATSNLELREEHSFLIPSQLIDQKILVNINGHRQPLSLSVSQ